MRKKCKHRCWLLNFLPHSLSDQLYCCLSCVFWLWLGPSNERHQQERLQEGRRELGVFISRTAAWCTMCLWQPSPLLKATAPAGHFAATASTIMSRFWKPILPKNPFKPLCATSIPPLLALGCFTILYWFPLNVPYFVNNPFIKLYSVSVFHFRTYSGEYPILKWLSREWGYWRDRKK